ncbi:protein DETOXIFICATION 46, chloroplastic-like [Euphorbia lathyris]|uniref:protein DETOXIFICATION 46, chloroplastic-like n=1 Tax=Euphorbia lathyris TaxID=212925 RepID=UPI0033135C89
MSLSSSSSFHIPPPQNPIPKTLSRPSILFKYPSSSSLPLIRTSRRSYSSISPLTSNNSHSKTHHNRKRLITACIGSGSEVIDELEPQTALDYGSESAGEEKKVEVVRSKREQLSNQSLWNQIKEIIVFSGPAAGLWICGPLMSLISTAVIGRGSSTELAALGPGTVFCDNMNLLFMFLSIATSNMVATSLAKRDKKEVQHQISVLLFVGLSCGILMLLFTQFLGSWALTAFAGPKNAHIIPAATKYVQIRGLAWPAILYGLVSQSSSLGMKDSMAPLKALLVATVVNTSGHLVLCTWLGYGIVGAAWSTMASQVIAAYMVVEALNKKGYNAYAVTIPSPKEFLHILSIAGPVFVTMFSKVAFYSVMTYFATAMGTFTVAAHQVMIQIYGMCMVWGEPLSQTAQSFMPELLYGVERSVEKARMLLKSLLIIGAILGVTIATIGTTIPWLFPNIFTRDPNVIQEMHKVLLLFFVANSAAPCTLSLEGTLLAGRDFKFISMSMSGCFSLGALVLLLISNKGYGVQGCWCALVAFQWGRFLFAIRRLLSPSGMLSSGDEIEYKLGTLKAA